MDCPEGGDAGQVGPLSLFGGVVQFVGFVVALDHDAAVGKVLTLVVGHIVLELIDGVVGLGVGIQSAVVGLGHQGRDGVHLFGDADGLE